MEQKLVRDLMSVGVPTCKTATNIVEIAAYIIQHNIEEMVVLGSEGEGIGVVGFEELIDVYGKDNFRSLTAENIMREGVPEIPADISLALAAKIMQDKKIRVAYLTHNSAGIIYPAAYISYRHILRHISAKSDTDLNDLGLSAQRKSPIETFLERRDEARKKAGLA